MSTRAYPNIKATADDIEGIFASAVCSGIVGDARHHGGYHRSRADNPAGNYSIVRPDDRAGRGPADASAAIDMTMNRRDMILATSRMTKVWSNPADPRRKYFNAVNGTTDGIRARRWDMVARSIASAGADHLWHMHLEWRRLFVLSTAARRATVSMLRGETVAQYLSSIGVTAAPAAAQPTGRTPAAGTAAAPVSGLTPPAYPGRVLGPGTRNSAALKAWQQRMRQRGWTSIGTPDGDYGPRTESVARRFQTHCKVPADALIGPRTWPLPWTNPLG